MLESEARETERKIVAILKVLSESPEPLGSISIARALENHGILPQRTDRSLSPPDHGRARVHPALGEGRKDVHPPAATRS